jgi:hypothetical protein
MLGDPEVTHSVDFPVDHHVQTDSRDSEEKPGLGIFLASKKQPARRATEMLGVLAGSKHEFQRELNLA